MHWSLALANLDVSAASFLKRVNAEGGASLDTLSPKDARQRFLEGFSSDKNPLEEVSETFEIENNDLRIMCWRGITAPKTDAPALLYLHGGGWLFGAPETHEDICRMIANRSDAVVLAPTYRLAPENPFPFGLEDCAKALLHVHTQASILGIDPNEIAVGGDSAGGNLAAVLALMARDGTVPALSAQLLIYPNTDQRQLTESFKKFAEGFGLTALEMAWFRNHYLPSDDLWTDWRASPILADSLTDVAPAVVILAGNDILYDEGVAYANRLIAESDAIVSEWPGQIHGFFSLARHMPETAEAISALCMGWRTLRNS